MDGCGSTKLKTDSIALLCEKGSSSDEHGESVDQRGRGRKERWTYYIFPGLPICIIFMQHPRLLITTVHEGRRIIQSPQGTDMSISQQHTGSAVKIILTRDTNQHRRTSRPSSPVLSLVQYIVTPTKHDTQLGEMLPASFPPKPG